MLTCAGSQSFRLTLGLADLFSDLPRLLLGQFLCISSLLSGQLLRVLLLPVEQTDSLLAEALQ